MSGQNRSEKRKQLAEHYASLMDGEIEELAGEGDMLTELAREALRGEIARRGLSIEVKEPELVRPQRERGGLTTLQVFNEITKALVAKSMLESAGIECLLSHENITRMEGLSATGGIKLEVRKEDAEAAIALLEAEIPDKFTVQGLGEFVQPRCPACNSLDISWEEWNKGATHAGLFVGVPMAWKKEIWKCNACGLEWPESRAEER